MAEPITMLIDPPFIATREEGDALMREAESMPPGEARDAAIEGVRIALDLLDNDTPQELLDLARAAFAALPANKAR